MKLQINRYVARNVQQMKQNMMWDIQFVDLLLIFEIPVAMVMQDIYICGPIRLTINTAGTELLLYSCRVTQEISIIGLIET